ncbi:MAG TPA: asparagine synthase (glutamine-hydrolyzing) [Cyclobacteriaceae bacterium]
MCGIAGFWSTQLLEGDSALKLKKMTEKLYHRGPDGEGAHFDGSNGLAMGHARLSIIDLETGRQPLYNHDKSHILTVNGEFYDYKKIRTKLRLEGFDFVSKSDSEIALPLYEKYGLDFVNHLRGEFAFTLYDQTKDRLILVRDRFGIKPLFFHLSQNDFFYASEIKALFAHPQVPRSFSSESVLHQLMHTMVPGTSAFKDIHAVKPGYMVIVERKNNAFELTEKKYWDMDFPTTDGRTRHSDDYYIQDVQQQLLEAVAHRLEADVPVGCYLSGGIDSCSMLGIASSMQQSPVKAFTISFDHSDYDEASIAKEMAQKVNADQVQINLSSKELYGENFIKTLWHAERTFYNTLGVAKYCMSKKVNESGYRVVVTGEGSDELFGGYPAFKKDLFLHDYSKEEQQSMLKKMDESNKVFKGAILAEEQFTHPALESLCGFTPSWIQPWIHTLSIARPLLHDDLLHETKAYDPIAAIANAMDKTQIEGRHVLDITQYTWIKTMLECQILNWGGDRVDMANSMESRPAFLDHHVAESAKMIPPRVRVKGNIEKWVLREAMKDILPEVLYKREKFAFMAPPSHTEQSKRDALDDLVNRFMREDQIKDAGLFDPDRLDDFMKEYKRDTNAVSLVRKDALVNHILGLHILHHHFIKNTID